MTKIYIACPPKYASGGPELLHQLCSTLNTLNFEAYMYYYGDYSGNPVNERFQKYNTEYVTSIDDAENNLFIVPEVNVNLLRQFKHIKKIIWWLSVDNYFISKQGMPIKHKIKKLFGLLDYNYKNKDLIHFAQSHYAIDFLKKQGINEEKVYYLSDYLNSTFIQNATKNQEVEKEDIILYNPKKGFEYTQKLIDKAQELNWVKLENLTPDEMSNLMLKSKVYIDFGNHPGKDRIPREAAISGCCVITGKRGSANYEGDVTIPTEFKFEDNDSSIPQVIDKINVILRDYNDECQKFEVYRDKIKNEERLFTEHTKEVFSELVKR